MGEPGREPTIGRALGALALLAALLTACATPQTERLLDGAAAGPPRRAQVAGVPFYPQEAYYCGPAALATVLAWTGRPVTQDGIAPEVYTPGRGGTLQSDIVAAARRHGRLAVPVGDLSGLVAEIAAGRPVLVFQNLGLGWYPRWHYAVAVGYDLDDDGGSLVLRSGTEAERVTPLRTFERTWARAGHWALVMLPPGVLPVAADEMTVLRAAAGLEQAGRVEEAGAAYAAITERWPDSLGAWIGLGNAAYAAGDLDGAERAFRTATDRHPNAAAAWNNLAHVLAERGRRNEAVGAARRAMRLGGGDVETYRATLQEALGP